PRRAARRLRRRHGSERLGEDDAPAHRRRARGAERRRAVRRHRARAPRLPRARAVGLPRADRAGEPRPLRPPLPRARAARADRHAPRALRPLGRAQRTRRLALARDAATARALPRAPARAGAAAARRAVLRARRRRRGAARPRARGARRRCDVPRLDARSGAPRTARERKRRVRMNYLSDVGALARKDLLLELRARDTLPAMLLFVASALVIFHFALPSGAGELAGLGLLWVAIVFTALLGLARAFVAEREQDVLDGLLLAPSDRSA